MSLLELLVFTSASGMGWMPKPALAREWLSPTWGLVKTHPLMGFLGSISRIPTFVWLKGAHLSPPRSPEL